MHESLLTLTSHSLPAAVQFALFNELKTMYTLMEVPLANDDSSAVMAHMLYNQWLIRFVQQFVTFSNQGPSQRPLTSTVEVTCCSPTQILHRVSHFYLILSLPCIDCVAVIVYCATVLFSFRLSLTPSPLPHPHSLSLSLSLSLPPPPPTNHQGGEYGATCCGVPKSPLFS